MYLFEILYIKSGSRLIGMIMCLCVINVKFVYEFPIIILLITKVGLESLYTLRYL